MDNFFSRLSYSLGNEDWVTEQQALQIQPHDTVLCITASGDRPLNLLNNECSKIISIDANPIQNYLLELKVAAMQVFDYEHYLSFLGGMENRNRKEDFKRLLPYLSQEAAEFWMKNQKMILNGVLYQGSIEKLTKVISVVVGLLRRKNIKKLFAIDDLEEQRRFVKEHWDKKWWRKVFELVLNPSISKHIVSDDPGLVNVGTSIKPGTYIYDRMLACLDRGLAKQNALFSLIFQGHVPAEAFSPYLTKEGTRNIKKRINRLKIQTGEVVQYLESIDQPTFDCFSLSDIASYMDYPHFERLLKAIYKTAKPGARFCIRQFMSSQQMPKEIQPFFVRDVSLEKKLEKEDRCFLYRFLTGTIYKSSDIQNQTELPLNNYSEMIYCNQK